MADFNVEFETKGDVVVARTQGYLDDVGGKLFLSKCTEYLNKGMSFFVFNFTQTPVINSTGLSNILDLIVQIVDYNEGSVAITGLSTLTSTAMKMTGVLTLCDAYPTEEEAIESLE